MDKRRDIINTAESLFYLNGFHAVSTDRLCQEAKVSTRTFYKYFPSREALTAAVMEVREARFFALLSAPDDPQAIAHLFDVMGQWMRENGTSGCFFLKAWGEYSGEHPLLADRAMAYRRAMRDYIARCVASVCGREEAELADTVWMLFEGVLTTALLLGATAAAETGKASAMMLLNRSKKP